MKRYAAILAILFIILALSACDLTVLKGQGLGEPGRSVLEEPTATSPASEPPTEASPISEGSSGSTPQEKSSPVEQTNETATATARGTSELPMPTPTPSEAGSAPAPVLPEALAEARMAMATALNAPPEELELVEIEAVEWPDGCLGQSLTGLMCTMVITPGYRGVVRYGEQEFVFRSNLTGTQLRLEPNTGQPLEAGETPKSESAQTTQVVITLVVEPVSPILTSTPTATASVANETQSAPAVSANESVTPGATVETLVAATTPTPTPNPTTEQPASSAPAVSTSGTEVSPTETSPTPASNQPTAETTAPAVEGAPNSAPSTMQTARLPDALLVGLGYRLSVAPGHVRVETANPRTWEDLCFGYLSVPQNACPAQPTKGYEGSLEALTAWFGGNPRYAYRSDEIGQVAYLTPEAALIAQAVLAANLGIRPKDVLLLKVEPWSWPDTCAQTPAPAPDALCVKVPLPGWRVVLSGNNVKYVYHTSLNGQVLQMVEGPSLK